MSIEDYRVDLKVRNNLLLTAIEQAGYKNVSQFSKAVGISASDVGEYVNLKVPPLNKEGHFRPNAQKIIDFLGVLPEDLWTHEQLTMELETNRAHFGIDKKNLTALLERTATGILEFEEPEQALEHKELRAKVQEVLDCLTPREKMVLLQRTDDQTLETAANILEVTRERVRQIEMKGKRKMKNYIKHLKLNTVLEDPIQVAMNGARASEKNNEIVKRIRAGLHPVELKNEV